ncbi:MAG: hypothetical protein JSU90_03965, partial [Nitrospiraceae bacterium]
MMQGTLNIFQRTILLWNDIHPYNAVHVVRVPGHLDASRLTRDISCCIDQCGIGKLSVDRNRRKYQYGGLPAPLRIRAVQGDDPAATLRREIEDQINLPFPAGRDFIPFRFFTVRDKDSFFLGLVYYHLIAGADSIITIFRHMVRSYLSEEQSAGCPPASLYPDTYTKRLTVSPSDMARWIFTIPRRITEVRRAIRPRYDDVHDNRNGFQFFSINDGRFRALSETAKVWGVTLNDMFLALVMQSVAPRALTRRRGKKKNISLSSIAAIRKDMPPEARDLFGLFLSSFNVYREAGAGTPLSVLARDIHAQTEQIKKHRLYLRTLLEMGAALVLIPWFFSTRKEKFYSKYNPVWAGITNININTAGGWPEYPGDVPADYLRAVSTGQAAPLVFSFTTLHDKIQVGVSYRETVFSGD